jgi:hypothetical protein
VAILMVHLVAEALVLLVVMELAVAQAQEELD